MRCPHRDARALATTRQLRTCREAQAWVAGRPRYLCTAPNAARREPRGRSSRAKRPTSSKRKLTRAPDRRATLSTSKRRPTRGWSSGRRSRTCRPRRDSINDHRDRSRRRRRRPPYGLSRNRRAPTYRKFSWPKRERGVEHGSVMRIGGILEHVVAA